MWLAPALYRAWVKEIPSSCVLTGILLLCFDADSPLAFLLDADSPLVFLLGADSPLVFLLDVDSPLVF